MRARIWGCRGSLATPGPDTVRYGGNTSCVEVSLDDGTVLILDAGTGIRPLGREERLRGVRRIDLFLTHLHLDHLEGLGFFQPLWDQETELHVWGPASAVKSLEERIARYLSPPLFPVHLADVPSRVTFHDAPEDGVQVGSARVFASPVSHQGPAVGYRVEEGGASLAYIPDHEPARGIDLASMQPEWISGYGVAAGADVLLHDSQYTEEEYPARVGWGHSSIEHVVRFARIADVGRLVLFHHDPLHTDDQLEDHHGRAVELWGAAGEAPVLAHEGLVLELAPGRARMAGDAG